MVIVKDIIREAIKARDKSYSPYSGFKVGACLKSRDGRLFAGCNIENAAYTPSNCAERTAFFKAISEGIKEFESIAIVGGYDEIKDYCPPCGVCRQVMMEFCNPESFKIILAKSEDDYKEMFLADMFPMGFGAMNLK